MRILGVDPDTHTTGWAIIEADEVILPKRVNIVEAGMVKTSRKLTGDFAVVDQCFKMALPNLGWDLAVIEGQYSDTETQNEAMFRVAQVAGAAARRLTLVDDSAERVCIVSPRLWTPGVGKDSRHRKAMRHWFNQSLAEIAEMAGCTEAQANHVVDGAGIARWLLRNLNNPTFKTRNRVRPRKR